MNASPPTLGLALLFPPGTVYTAANGIDLFTEARAAGIEHLLFVCDEAAAFPTDLPAYVRRIEAPATPEVALAHSQAVDVLILMTARDLPGLLPALLSAARAGVESDQIRRVQPVVSPPPPGWIPGEPVKLLGVTIVTPGYEDLARIASERWRRFTGQPCLVLEAPNTEKAWLLKLSLPQFVPTGPVCYFDADWWAVRPLPLPDLLQALEEADFVAVPDPGWKDPDSFVAADCARHGLDPKRYVNSGFWLTHTARPQVLTAFDTARRLYLTQEWLDFGEQSALNAALQTTPGLTQAFLPPAWNFFLHAVTHGYMDAIPACVLGLHAAGVPVAKKADHLSLYAAALNYPIKPLRVVETPAPPPPQDTEEDDPQLLEWPRQFYPPPRKMSPAAHEKAIAAAWATFYDLDSSFDQRCSAHCYLIYRTIDGLVPIADFERKLDSPVLGLDEVSVHDDPQEPLVNRWRCSLGMAVTYLYYLRGDDLTRYPRRWQHTNGGQLLEAARWWPPQILNVVRYRVIDAYRKYLEAEIAPDHWRGLILALHADWTTGLASNDPFRHPYRYTEAHNDLRAMQCLMFIARAAGVMDFPDYDWCPQNAILRNDYFGQTLVKLGELNPDRALWTKASLPSS